MPTAWACGPASAGVVMAIGVGVLACFQTALAATEGEEEDPSIWLYVSIPLVSAAVGWGTNVVALKMTFYPTEFFGIPIKRYACGADQPVGCIGWQGIIPAKAAKMAAISTDLMTRDLFQMDELFGRLNPMRMAEEMRPGCTVMMKHIIGTVASKHIPSVWAALPQHVQDEVVAKAVEDTPGFVAAFFGDLQAHLDEMFDLKEMVVTHFSKHKEQLNEVFLRCGQKELKFIERSGAYFGFLFGLVQAVVWFFVPEWWIMPLAGFLVGYLTNFLALKMIFEPIFPVYVCGIKFQGLFLQRQREVSKEFAKVQASNLLKSETMWQYMLTGRLSSVFYARLKAHSRTFTNRMLGPVKAVIVLYMGADAYDALIENIATMVAEELPNNIKHLHDYTNEALDMEVTLRTRMAQLSPDKFEGVLHPAFQEDELKLILVGAALGVMVGFFQVFVVFAG